MAASKITVRLQDEVVDWARAQAARNNMPLGRFLGEIVMDGMREWRRQGDAAQLHAVEPPEIPGDPGRNP